MCTYIHMLYCNSSSFLLLKDATCINRIGLQVTNRSLSGQMRDDSPISVAVLSLSWGMFSRTYHHSGMSMTSVADIQPFWIPWAFLNLKGGCFSSIQICPPPWRPTLKASKCHQVAWSTWQDGFSNRNLRIYRGWKISFHVLPQGGNHNWVVKGSLVGKTSDLRTWTFVSWHVFEK